MTSFDFDVISDVPVGEKRKAPKPAAPAPAEAQRPPQEIAPEPRSREEAA